MRVAGIIAEYDPFHNGHLAHIQATREQGEATHIVAVISGSFTQRGEPALLSKFHRAEMALECGADLVLELPVPWAMAPAEQFARGGVSILKALGCIDVLSFGSECGNVETLTQLADLMDKPPYKEILQQELDTGIPYAAAKQSAAHHMLGDKANHLSGPNNTLATEYIVAAKKLQANFTFFTLKRHGATHNGVPNSKVASASWIREKVQSGNVTEAKRFMPTESYQILTEALAKGVAPASVQKMEGAVLAQLRKMTQEQLAHLPYLSEGIENRLYTAIQNTGDIFTLLQQFKTKRYPLSRLRRILWAAFLGMDNSYEGSLPLYIRVLGMNDRGKEILSASAPTLPIITRSAQVHAATPAIQMLFELECRATDLHGLFLPNPPPCATDRMRKLLVLP